MSMSFSLVSLQQLRVDARRDCVFLSGTDLPAAALGCDRCSPVGVFVLNLFLHFSTEQRAQADTRKRRDITIADVPAGSAADHFASRRCGQTVPVLRIGYRRHLLIPAFVLAVSRLSNDRLRRPLVVEK
jgi:hypothetical protein